MTYGAIQEQLAINDINICPCPFCGNDTNDKYDLQGLRLVQEKRTSPGYGLIGEERYIYYVKCYKCYAEGGKGITGYNALVNINTDKKKAKAIAIKKWNTRASKSAGLMLAGYNYSNK